MTMNEELDPTIKSLPLSSQSRMNKDFSLKDVIELPDIAAERSDEPDRVSGLAGNSTRQSLRVVHANLSNSLQIKTTLDGLNSGKTYYLSTRSSTDPEQTRLSVVLQLRAIVMSARRKAEAKSRFQKSQEKVQLVQSSLAFQLCMALLIMVVMQPSLNFWRMCPLAMSISHAMSIVVCEISPRYA
jgi:hypothetical protein